MDNKTFINIVIDLSEFFSIVNRLGESNESIKNRLKTHETLTVPFGEIEDRIISDEFNRLLEKYVKP